MSQEEELSRLVENLRAGLLEHSGFEHARATGELRGTGANGTPIHIRTGYTHGSYRLVAFGRYRGERQGAHFVDFNRGADPGRIADVAESIANWDGVIWPPHADFRPCPVGQGQGWPQ